MELIQQTGVPITSLVLLLLSMPPKILIRKSKQMRKPQSKDRAVDMLHRLSGKEVSFFTTVGFCAPNTPLRLHTEEVVVSVRKLSHAEIVRYVDADEPLDCAGGFKVECLGISLFRSVKSEDPTALEGLPLIQLCQWLRDQGFSIP